jgi:DNA-binding NarL/FixJ family response regulator
MGRANAGTHAVTIRESKPITIMIIDGHEAVRRALGMRLNAPAHLEVVGVADDPLLAIELLPVEKPDVIVLGMHHSSDEERAKAVDAVREMSRSSCSVLVLAPYVDAVERELLLDAGAKRYLLKQIDSNQLIREIEMLAARPANV